MKRWRVIFNAGTELNYPISGQALTKCLPDVTTGALPSNCRDEDDKDELIYPFDAFELKDKDNPSAGFTGNLERQVTGNRTFDFNVDGVAHIGLIPDMLADAKTNFSAILNPLF